MSNFLTLNLVVHEATTRLSCKIRVPDRVAKKFRTTNHNSLLLKCALYFHITVCPSLAVLQYILTQSNYTGRLYRLPSGNFPTLIARVCVCVCVCVCVRARALRARFHASFLLSCSPSLCTKQRDTSNQLLAPCKGCWQRRSLYLEVLQSSKQFNFWRVRKNAERDDYLRHVCLHVRLSTWYNSVHKGRILMNIYI